MVLVLTTEEDTPKPETEVLFSIDGINYEIPKVFGVNVGLQFARMTLLRGPEVAMAWALEEAIGADGVAALMAFEQLKREDLQTITVAIYQRMVAALEGPKAGLKAV